MLSGAMSTRPRSLQPSKMNSSVGSQGELASCVTAIAQPRMINAWSPIKMQPSPIKMQPSPIKFQLSTKKVSVHQRQKSYNDCLRENAYLNNNNSMESSAPPQQQNQTMSKGRSKMLASFNNNQK